MSVEPEAMADVVRWCQEKRLDLGEEPRPWALFYFFGRMDCLFCWPRRRCFLLSFARNPLVAVDANKQWSDCKGAVSLGKIRLCRGTRSSASHTSEARATQVLSSKGPAATGPFHDSLRYPLLLIFPPDRVEVPGNAGHIHREAPDFKKQVHRLHPNQRWSVARRRIPRRSRFHLTGRGGRHPTPMVWNSADLTGNQVSSTL